MLQKQVTYTQKQHHTNLKRNASKHNQFVSTNIHLGIKAGFACTSSNNHLHGTVH